MKNKLWKILINFISNRNKLLSMCTSVYFPFDIYEKTHMYVSYDVHMMPLSYNSHMKIAFNSHKIFMWIIWKGYHILIICGSYDLSHMVPFLWSHMKQIIWSIYDSHVWSYLCTLRDRNVEPKAYVGIEPLKKKKRKKL